MRKERFTYIPSKKDLLRTGPPADHPAATVLGGRGQPKHVAALRRNDWLSRAEICTTRTKYKPTLMR